LQGQAPQRNQSRMKTLFSWRSCQPSALSCQL
jgi:hypothetical protein